MHQRRLIADPIPQRHTVLGLAVCMIYRAAIGHGVDKIKSCNRQKRISSTLNKAYHNLLKEVHSLV